MRRDVPLQEAIDLLQSNIKELSDVVIHQNIAMNLAFLGLGKACDQEALASLERILSSRQVEAPEHAWVYRQALEALNGSLLQTPAPQLRVVTDQDEQ